MALSATNSGFPDEPQGDLEHLFRQKFAEAEVSPRRNIWEQIDHDLLVRQNEDFRQRLTRQRWVAAACGGLVLVAATTLTLRPAAPEGNRAAWLKTGPPASATPARLWTNSTDRVTTGLPGLADTYRPAAAGTPGGTRPDGLGAAGLAGAPGLAFTSRRPGSQPAVFYAGLTSQPVVFMSVDEPTAGHPALASAEPELMTTTLSRLATSLPDTLRKRALPAGPVLAAQPNEVAESTVSPVNRPWRWSATVAASAYNPNINFSRAAHGVAASSASTYEQAASEYRRALTQRAGVVARVGATRQLGRHWELTTGLEVASQAASSQVKYYANQHRPQMTDAFAGTSSVEAALAHDMFSNPGTTTATRATRYRYTTAGVPVAVRYGSSKTGWSLYATVGAAVDVLLASRVDVAGVADAARTYSIGSADSPYRKVVASVRGGGGGGYRSADGRWSLLVGPEAAAGLTTLNADPAQSFFKRSRPYSVGLATTVEFGGPKAVATIQ